MSHQITLNSWFGSDPDQAAKKLAKVFRMSLEQSETVVDKLRDGRPWKFARKISDHQAGPAAAYLQSLGFQVDLQPLDSTDDDAMDSPAEQEIPANQYESSESELSLPFAFRGQGKELFGITFVNLLKTIVTLGIYRFWAKTKVRQYLWSNTVFAGDSFSYQGTGKELFRGFLKFIGMLISFMIVLGVLQAVGGPIGQMAGGLAPLIFWPLVPVLMVGAWRYRLSRTAWRGIRFSFRGERKKAMMIYMKGGFLTAITLGLYWPFFRMQAEAFWRENSWFGNLQGEFTGEGKEIFGKYVLAIFLSIITMGIYWIWFSAYMQRYRWSHTRFGNAHFRFTATGGELFVLNLVNVLLLVFTVGLSYPWVVVRNQKFFTAHLTLEGDVDMDSVVQEMKESGAVGEEALDAFDIPVDVG
ncbi:MAG: DUF898 domain-containing protein [Nitrospinae bacterium]|nr:DUF898 domain-containing protein [Nitrospinota bacterium]